MPVANILDPISSTLPDIWDDPASTEPKLKQEYVQWITHAVYDALEKSGYKDPDSWTDLVLTGSLTTYQYSDASDCDVSLFVHADKVPDWSRAEMIGILTTQADGKKLPNDPYTLQCFVVGNGIRPEDLFQPKLRAGYDIKAAHWIQPPDPSHVRDVEIYENGFYTFALQQADKMELLLRYEPEKAKMLWHQIHDRRRRINGRARATSPRATSSTSSSSSVV